jgi:putative chitinase
LITADEIHRIMPHAADRVERFEPHINHAMTDFEIDNTLRIGAFIAQVAHESGELRYVRELASGESYEGRLDLGNTEPGDGPRFRGRGLIQITGRHNYQQCGNALGQNLLSRPELLEEPEYASRSAAWFWSSRGLNELADKEDFRLITKRINGGYTHYKQRYAYYMKALKVLS